MSSTAHHSMPPPDAGVAVAGSSCTPVAGLPPGGTTLAAAADMAEATRPTPATPTTVISAASLRIILVLVLMRSSPSFMDHGCDPGRTLWRSRRRVGQDGNALTVKLTTQPNASSRAE